MYVCVVLEAASLQSHYVPVISICILLVDSACSCGCSETEHSLGEEAVYSAVRGKTEVSWKPVGQLGPGSSRDLGSNRCSGFQELL